MSTNVTSVGRQEADEVDARADVDVAGRRSVGDAASGPDVLREVVRVVGDVGRRSASLGWASRSRSASAPGKRA